MTECTQLRNTYPFETCILVIYLIIYISEKQPNLMNIYCKLEDHLPGMPGVGPDLSQIVPK